MVDDENGCSDCEQLIEQIKASAYQKDTGSLLTQFSGALTCAQTTNSDERLSWLLAMELAYGFIGDISSDASVVDSVSESFYTAVATAAAEPQVRGFATRLIPEFEQWFKSAFQDYLERKDSVPTAHAKRDRAFLLSERKLRNRVAIARRFRKHGIAFREEAVYRALTLLDSK